MKRVLICMAVLVLLMGMSVSAFAEGDMSVSSAIGKPGQTVEITLTIDGSLIGEQVSVEYSYDDQYLTPQPSSSKWYPKGDISNFHNIKNIGAWGASEPKELKGKLCSLSFLVKPGVSFDSTAVSCTVTVLKGGKEAAKYTASGNVMTSCLHSYGLWESTGEFSHERSCTVCGEKQTAAHSWDVGKQIPDPQNTSDSLMVYTCNDCKGTLQVPLKGVHTPATEPEPTVPPTEGNHGSEPSRPTEPDRYVTPTVPTAPPPERDPFTGEIIQKDPNTGEIIQGSDPTTPTQGFVDYNEPDHTHPETTIPLFIEHDHDHSPTATEEERSVGGLIVLAIGLVIVGALVFVVKKRS